ncbi:hypothetical protein PRZ48_012629 [Zasmidium cellare]|uniref:Uncharacterized protein n=1 Tax=Zasmidium cellare TaxID=395010 RepID=A0ABR0E5E4_ZASCE|nr:hypothetical protein PRZ48_012629 [Zasmidium cellare]
MRLTTTIASLLALLSTTLALPIVSEKNVTEAVAPSPKAATYHIYKAAWKREAEPWKRRELIDPKAFDFEKREEEAADPKTLILWRDAEAADPKTLILWRDAEAEEPKKYELWRKDADAKAEPEKFKLWKKDAKIHDLWKKDAEADAMEQESKFKLWRKEADAEPVVTAWKRDAEANKNKFELWKKEAEAEAEAEPTIQGAW